MTPRLRLMRRRKFRWLPEFGSCGYRLGETCEDSIPMREDSVFWLWWALSYDRPTQKPEAAPSL